MSTIDSLSQLIFNIYEAFTVAFFIKEHDYLKCLSSVSFAASFDKTRPVTINNSLPGWVAKHNEPLIIPNFDKDVETLGYYGSDEGIKSFMGYPMEGKGVIIVDSKKKWVFTDKEKKILGSFVALIGDEIEREKKAQDVEEIIEELTMEKKIMSLFHELNLSHLSIQEIFRELLNLSGADLCFTGIEKNRKLFLKDILGVVDDSLFGPVILFGQGGTAVEVIRDKALVGRERKVFIQRATAMFHHFGHIDHALDLIICQDIDLLDFMGSTETVEKVKEGYTTAQGCRLCDQGKVHDFLDIVRAEHGPAG